jgi:adenine-specific DNA-methyltransferase
MRAILDCEADRLAEQTRLDRLKTARQRNCWGQFATPPELSLEIAEFAWTQLRRREGKFHFLDPAVGTGSFFAAFRQVFPADRVESALGIELDEVFAGAAASLWQSHGLQVIQGDFTRQTARTPYNVILTNPPYVRHHHLSAAEKRRLGNLVRETTDLQLSGLAGLYCYFLLIAHAWLAENGLAVWLIPSEFMDVNYGEAVKRYLTEQVSLVRVHRFCPSDVQFDDALVSSAVIAFVKRKPSQNHETVFSFGGTLTDPKECRNVPLAHLRENRKWNTFTRPPNSNRRTHEVLFGDLFTVKRGIATGGNAFFVVPKSQLRHLGVPLGCVRPILPSPRFLRQEIVESDEEGWPILDEPPALIDCSLPEEEVRKRWPRFWAYLEEGKRRQIDRGYITSRRRPWYSQEHRDPPPFLCTYMGRSRERPFRFIWNRSEAVAANVYLLLYPKKCVKDIMRRHAADVFDAMKAVAPEDFFDAGRVYGGGLHKMEPAELLRLPADSLAEAMGLKMQRQLAFF